MELYGERFWKTSHWGIDCGTFEGMVEQAEKQRFLLKTYLVGSGLNEKQVRHALELVEEVVRWTALADEEAARSL